MFLLPEHRKAGIDCLDNSVECSPELSFYFLDGGFLDWARNPVAGIADDCIESPLFFNYPPDDILDGVLVIDIHHHRMHIPRT